jgi:hypothetical protein
MDRYVDMSGSMAIVLYLGPSQINGTPIVALATLDSSNVKTGPMIQTWIVPVDGPLNAYRSAEDDAVCGDCPRRRSLGGDCYVRLDAAPHSAWKRWNGEGRPGVNWDAPEHVIALQKEGRDHGLRLGAYGDPAAVPAHVWIDLIAAIQPRTITGYTHQWRRAYDANPLGESLAALRGLVMASCDSTDDARAALALGWRYFVALPLAPSELPGRAVQCLADARGRTCEECGICNGARLDRADGAPQPTSVWIAEVLG